MSNRSHRSRSRIPPPSGEEVQIRVRYRIDVSKTRATFETTTIHLATFETTMTTTTATTRDDHRSCSGSTLIGEDNDEFITQRNVQTHDDPPFGSSSTHQNHQ